jgi:hypothetical protein
MLTVAVHLLQQNQTHLIHKPDYPLYSNFSYSTLRKRCINGYSHEIFLYQSGTNSEQAAAINAALATELEMDAKPASMITTKNHACEFFIQKAKLKNLHPITCMSSLSLNSSKSIHFFNGNHKHFECLHF